jgi:nucleotide-binding universal stress UspA family protein
MKNAILNNPGAPMENRKVTTPTETRPSTEGPWRHILVPVELIPDALRALSLAADLASRHGLRITILHVIDRGSFMNDLDNVLLVKSEQAVAERARRVITRWMRKAGLASGVHEVMIQRGEPAREILRVAEETKADLVLMAARPPEGGWRWWRQPVARRVAAQAPCPVRFVPIEVKTPLGDADRWWRFRPSLIGARPGTVSEAKVADRGEAVCGSGMKGTP